MTSSRGSAPATERAPSPGGAAPQIPVLVVEDNRLLRDGIVGILNRQEDLEVAAASSPDHALEHLTRRPPPPGVVVVDAGLADHDPPNVVARLAHTVPEARIVVMDLMPNPDDIVGFVKAGACGFIMKDATVGVFVKTIRTVAAGREVLPPALTGTLFSYIAQHVARRPQRTAHQGLVRMTRREREIVGLIAEGLSNKEIAQRVHLSPHTVKSHVHNILEKLALNSRLQVAAYVHQIEGDTEAP